jgi:hypothetical protein
MFSKTLTALSIFFLSSLVTAYPLDASLSTTAAASGRNIYLVTCIPRTKNSDDKPPPTSPPIPFTAIAYCREPLSRNNTSPEESTKAPKPDQSVIVANPALPWEGVRWSVKAWKDKIFTAEIAIGAETETKGSIAGSAKLDAADYVCFRDGETQVRYKDDDLRGDCIADYWCAGLEAGKNEGGS